MLFATYITVVVANGRWNSFGYPTPTFYQKCLARTLQNQGGVNESVFDGTYHYYLVREGLRINYRLDPCDCAE